MPPTSIGRLRRIGFFEALSFLALLGIAMPLKYFAGLPEAVKIVGWLHGVLFIALCWALVVAAREHRWSLRQVLLVFGAALFPFGPFLIDASLQREEQRALVPETGT